MILTVFGVCFVIACLVLVLLNSGPMPLGPFGVCAVGLMTAGLLVLMVFGADDIVGGLIGAAAGLIG